MSRITLSAAAMIVMGLGIATSASAQGTSPSDPAGASGGERINQIIVYGNDACPPSTSPDEITVCARKEETERYRIPENLRGSESPANRAWTDRVKAYETVGNFGTNSCSPVGAGGFTGCSQQLIRQAYAEKETGPQVQFSDLIAKEREKRLSTIDADARATQARVEAAEREYEAREAAAATRDPAAAVTSATPAPRAP